MHYPRVAFDIVALPGLLVYEYVQILMCRMTNTRVLNVFYLRLEEPVGYVVTEKPSCISKSIAILLVPTIVNNVAAILISTTATLIYKVSGADGLLPLLYFLLIYFGVCLAFHSFPNYNDSKAFAADIFKKETPIAVKILCIPIALLFVAKAAINFLVIDLIWGLGVVLLPYILIAGK